MDDKTERPIGFASRTLSKAEQNYSMVQKEALALYWGVKKFSQYLIGREFRLFTDHKNLLALFGENKNLPHAAAGRILRWAVYLSAFNYTLRYMKGSSNEADVFSRLPINAEKDEFEVERLNFLDENPVDSNKVRIETGKDSVLNTVETTYKKDGLRK